MHPVALRVFGTALALGSVMIGTCAAQDAAPPSTAAAAPAVAPLATVTAAVANDPTAQRFATLDDDRDGKLTQAEYEVGANARFATLDADHNNRVSIAEVTAANPAQRDGMRSAADRIRAMDTNVDGELTDEELRHGADKVFVELDTDRNGEVDLAELRSGAGFTDAGP